MDDGPEGLQGFLAEAKRRRVGRTAVIYVMGSFVAWQVAEIAVPALRLPDVVLTIVVVGTIVLFPFALLGAWVYDLRLQKDDESTPLWDVLPGGGKGAVAIGLIGTVAVGAAIFGGQWIASRADPGAPSGSPGGDRVAVFPLTTVAIDDAMAYGEWIAELVHIGLDGTPGINVLDRAAFWPPVVQAGVLSSVRSDEARFLETSRRFGLHRYLTGTVVLAGSSLDVSIRVHDGRSGDELGTVRAYASNDSLSHLVDRLIVELVAELWDAAAVPAVPTIDRLVTEVPRALQSYLEAMRLYRLGDVAGAEVAIEEAVAADSSFAMAHLAHFQIKSTTLMMAGDPLTGVHEIVQRAERHAARLTTRDRRRVTAHMALDRTDGTTAIGEIERILEADPDDVAARNLQAFTIAHYGWQFGQDRGDALVAYDRALTLDSASVPLMDMRFGAALRDLDLTMAEQLLRRMERSAPESPLSVGNRLAFDLVTAPEERADSLVSVVLAESVTVAIHALRRLRGVSPAQALYWSRRLSADAPGVRHRAVGRGGEVQLLLAAGDPEAVDSLARRELPTAPLRLAALRMLLAADLVGVGDGEAAPAAAADLEAQVPPDSVAAYMESHPEPWAVAWSVGAWHATRGDTLTARAYIDGIDANPREGIPEAWPDALIADLESRLAERRGDANLALTRAQEAYDLWHIQDPLAGEWYPAPAIRFHLAERLAAAGREEEAAALYQSFVSFTWVGFYTPLAAYRMGRTLESAGDREGARFAYRQAIELWRLGDPRVVGELLGDARARLATLDV